MSYVSVFNSKLPKPPFLHSQPDGLLMVAVANFTILATDKHINCFADKKKDMFMIVDE